MKKAHSAKYRIVAIICTLIIALLLIFMFRGKIASIFMEDERQPYGVFLGIESDELEKLYDYDEVVIDPEYFSKEDIESLKSRGIIVYGYLNVGALENFRDYYDQYKEYALGDYEEWEEEKWMDISRTEWQKFLAEQAEHVSDKGIDGFFLDNFDVYYQYESEKIYRGLITILEEINQYSSLVLINGGDVFAIKYLSENPEQSLISGVNQEDVFTNYDFDHDTYGLQDEETKAYYMEYLDSVKKAGLDVYLLEYRASSSVEKEISSYCDQNGFQYYNSHFIELI